MKLPTTPFLKTMHMTSVLLCAFNKYNIFIFSIFKLNIKIMLNQIVHFLSRV